MAAKRFYDDSESGSDQPNGKRMRTRPSLASVISEVMMTNFLRNFCGVLEPMLRKVVNEEVENGLKRGIRSLSRSASLLIQAPPETPSLQLMFLGKLSLPIFTGSKILDTNNSSIQIVLVDKNNNHLVPRSLPYPIKIEIVVLDGDFPCNDNEMWTSREFEKKIVRERTGKRPLIAGESQVTIRDGFVTVGDIEFTDNSSWIRSRKFRLGARVVQSGSKGIWVRETMTEAFVVKDHRGELYKKHHPPMLEDDVWRLEKIGKEGAFHKKLASAGINTVQDFLKLQIVDPFKLRKILGVGMSEKMWEVTVKHAKTCVMGNKLYIDRGPNYTIVLNPICEVVKAEINGQIYSIQDSASTINRAYLDNFVRTAFVNWNSLDEVDGMVNDQTPTLTQGDVVDEFSSPHSLVRPYQQHAFISDRSTNMVPSLLNTHTEYSNEWPINSSVFFPSPTSESSSDGHLTPLKSLFNGR